MASPFQPNGTASLSLPQSSSSDSSLPSSSPSSSSSHPSQSSTSPSSLSPQPYTSSPKLPLQPDHPPSQVATPPHLNLNSEIFSPDETMEANMDSAVLSFPPHPVPRSYFPSCPSLHAPPPSNKAVKPPSSDVLDVPRPTQDANQDTAGRQALNQNAASANPLQPGFAWDPATLLEPQHTLLPGRQTPLPIVAPAPVSNMNLPDLAAMNNAAAFGSPGSFQAPVPVPTPLPASQPTNGLGPVPGSSALAFEFMSSTEPTTMPLHHKQSHPPHVTDLTQSSSPVQVKGETPVNGMASLVERGFHLQDRADVPEPKRRKVLTPDSHATPKQAFKHTSSGLLAGGIKDEKSANGNAEAKRTSTPKGSAAITVDLTDAGDDNVKGKESYEEVCFGQLQGVTVDCHKVPSPKPGSLAMGGPAYWPYVKIVLRRKADDKSSLIQVYDHTREVFGSLDAQTAKALVNLIDVPSVHLRPDARIPSRRKLADETVGQPVSRSYKIDLILYGSHSFARAVGKHLAKFNRRLIEPARVQPGIRLVIPQFAPPVPNVDGPSATPGRSGHSTPPIASTSTSQTKTVEEIRAEVMSVFDSMGSADDLPELDPDPSVTTPMLKHQKQALYFMTNREKPLDEQANTKLKSSIWQEKKDHKQQTVYYNTITRQNFKEKPSETLGGILADMMGLGKTLSILSLVASTKQAAAEWYEATPDQPKAPVSKKSSLGSSFEPPTPHGLGLTRVRENGRGTLLVCPLSTITNWEEQIKQHLKEDSLTYHIYHGQNRIKDVEKLREFDLVITTYGSVSSELTGRSKKKPGEYPLEEVGWFRIVLDEAHMIREQATLQFKAICRLQASRRWAVTGTPVQNRLDDLGSLLAFLRLKPFDERSKFTYHVVNPFKGCDPNILPRLRILVDTITLRRLKDKIDLPSRKDEVVKLDFSPDERVLYDFYNRNAQERLQVLTGRNERLMGGKTYIHILQAILRLRLICAHGRDLLSEEDLKLTQGMTLESAIDLDDDNDENGNEAKPALTDAKAYEVFDLLTNTNADVCEHCKRKVGAALETSDVSRDIRSEKQEDIVCYMSPCFHVFCPDCVKFFRDEQLGLSHKSGQPGTCPICSEKVVFSCRALRHERAEAEHDAPPHMHSSNSSNNLGHLGHLGHLDPTGAPVTISRNNSNTKLRAMGSSGGTTGGSLNKTINESDYSGPHTKTKALIHDLLLNAKESEELLARGEMPIKSVVFSGWTSHLDLIQLALQANGVQFCRLDGKMTRLARTQAMDTFRESRDVTVILVSIMAGGLGLNLTAGNHVYVMEPQYNPAAEAQAIDRVHRLGQKRPVFTKRYIMRNSFEERMQDIQKMKTDLANLSMNKDRNEPALSVADAARQRLQNLRSLFK